MKKLLSLFPIFIVVSLLIGMIVTVSTSRVSGMRDGNSAQYCGLIINRQTGQLAKFDKCPDKIYGYPVKYVTSGVSSTVIANQTEYASYSLGYTSFSRLRFLADWSLWSAVSGVVIIGIGAVTSSTSKQATRKKK